MENGKSFLAEVKGNFVDLLDARMHRSIEATLDYCQQHGIGFLLCCSLRTFEYFAECPINKNLEQKILSSFNNKGLIYFKEFKAILEETGALKKEAMALIMRNNWGYYSIPFKLTLRNPYPAFRKAFIEKFL